MYMWQACFPVPPLSKFDPQLLLHCHIASGVLLATRKQPQGSTVSPVGIARPGNAAHVGTSVVCFRRHPAVGNE